MLLKVMTWIGIMYFVGLDNTNTNMGSRNSLRTRIFAENPQTFIAGCNCHLAHLAIRKGGEACTSKV